MLIRFSVENFRSFKERQELSLVASSLADLPTALIQVEGFRHKLLRAAAIYGPNASGKTNLLRAIQYVRDAVNHSQRNWAPDKGVPRTPFRLNNSESQPSSFEIEFLLQGARYRYAFTTDSERVLSESLSVYPGGSGSKEQVWFNRDAKRTGRLIHFGRKFGGRNRVIESLTRPNSLFLSAAAQNDHPLVMPVYNYLTNGLIFSLDGRIVGQANQAALDLCKNEARRQTLLRLLAHADLGIANFVLEEEEWPENSKKIFEFLDNLYSMETSIDRGKQLKLSMLHRAGNGQVQFPIQDESAGTQALYSLLVPALLALEVGSTLCVDELDTSLHPLLALELVQMFNNSESNPSNAQLIFNTHDTNLLDSSVLRRDQVWFAEKDAQGASHLYPLSDFKPRKDENLGKGYLQGRYGAIPFIGDNEFARSLKAE